MSDCVEDWEDDGHVCQECERLQTKIDLLQASCDKWAAVVDKIADGEPGVPYSCIDVRGIAKAAREDDE